MTGIGGEKEKKNHEKLTNFCSGNGLRDFAGCMPHKSFTSKLAGRTNYAYELSKMENEAKNVETCYIPLPWLLL